MEDKRLVNLQKHIECIEKDCVKYGVKELPSSIKEVKECLCKKEVPSELQQKKAFNDIVKIRKSGRGDIR